MVSHFYILCRQVIFTVEQGFTKTGLECQELVSSVGLITTGYRENSKENSTPLANPFVSAGTALANSLFLSDESSLLPEW